MIRPSLKIPNQKRGSNGFTLVEVIVSLVILAILIGIIGQFLVSRLRNEQRNLQRINIVEQLEQVFNEFTSDPKSFCNDYPNESFRYYNETFVEKLNDSNSYFKITTTVTTVLDTSNNPYTIYRIEIEVYLSLTLYQIDGNDSTYREIYLREVSDES